MAEVFATFATLIRHFSSVNSFVLSKVVLAAKGFSTFTALIRPFSCVDSLVLDKCGFAAERFPTFTALVRLFSSMDSLVLDKCIFATESFPTFTALVMHLSNVIGLPALSAPCFPLAVGGLLLVTPQTSLEVLLLLLTCKGLLWQVRFFTSPTVLHKWGPAFVSS